MNIHKKLAVTTSGVAFLLTTMGAAPAVAAIFNFSYFGAEVQDPTQTVTASGVLTTDPLDPVTDSYQITDITGTRITANSKTGTKNEVSIDSLLSPNSILDNDNLLFADSRQLDDFGFGYTTADGQLYNVFNSYTYLELSTDITGEEVTGGRPLTSFSITPVPEPSSVLGILGISVLTGGTLLKQKLKQK